MARQSTLNIPKAIEQIRGMPWGAELTARTASGTARVRKAENGSIWVRREDKNGRRWADVKVSD